MQIFPSTLPVLGFARNGLKWSWTFRNIAVILQKTVTETQLLLHQVIAGRPTSVGNWCCKRRVELPVYVGADFVEPFATDICDFFRNTLEPGMLHMTEESQLNVTIGEKLDKRRVCNETRQGCVQRLDWSFWSCCFVKKIKIKMLTKPSTQLCRHHLKEFARFLLVSCGKARLGKDRSD